MKIYKIKDVFNIEKGELQSSKNTPGIYNFITASADWKTHESYSHECEALIFAMGASGSLGRTHYVNDKFITSDLCFILTPKEEFKDNLEMKLYYYYFNYMREKIVAATATGTSKKAINLTNFSNYSIEYVDNQTVLLRKIETILMKKEELNQITNRSLSLIDEARVRIVNNAVIGQMSPSEKANSDFLSITEMIAEKRQDLKIKKDKSIKALDGEQISFDIPKGWEWIRFGEIIHSSRYGTSKKTTYESKGTPILRIPNVSKGRLELNDIKSAILTEREAKDLSLEYDDMLLVRSNGSSSIVGKAILVDRDLKDYGFAGYLVRVKLFKEFVHPPYIQAVLNSKFVRNQIEPNLRTTTGVKNINTKEIYNLILPLPPIDEQKRVISKVEKLSLQLDELLSKAKKAKTETDNLMKYVLEESFYKN